MKGFVQMGILLFLMHPMAWQRLISKFMMINTIMLSVKEVWSFLEKSPQVKMKYFIGLSNQASVPLPPAWLPANASLTVNSDDYILKNNMNCLNQ
ncbi:hypothetical protein Dd586_2413 [Dickeya parazeae Ech586]|uniref:Uncharacterized protein n=1 Tax=Dickeya zeae (strain Ech586) TaxID=590409 RepID=D2C298_DICZ5|nr:hypothetical protein Dd586_2413 [Dickeya parazeae Ech586]